MSITAEEIKREKKTLPFGWGRFGKTLERLEEISEPDESLLASCAALNPQYQQTGRFVPGTALSAIHEVMKTTNVVLACTDKRLIGIGTNVAGGPREHFSHASRIGTVETVFQNSPFWRPGCAPEPAQSFQNASGCGAKKVPLGHGADRGRQRVPARRIRIPTHAHARQLPDLREVLDRHFSDTDPTHLDANHLRRVLGSTHGQAGHPRPPDVAD
jgi:hypothetical protein